MKVRHITNNPDTEYEVVGQSDAYYFCAHVIGGSMTALPKSEYSLVPASSHWEDVTNQVHRSHEYRDGGSLFKQDGFGPHIIQVRKDYRLRKVNFGTMLSPAWAFLIERKVVE